MDACNAPLGNQVGRAWYLRAVTADNAPGGLMMERIGCFEQRGRANLAIPLVAWRLSANQRRSSLY